MNTEKKNKNKLLTISALSSLDDGNRLALFLAICTADDDDDDDGHGIGDALTILFLFICTTDDDGERASFIPDGPGTGEASAR